MPQRDAVPARGKRGRANFYRTEGSKFEQENQSEQWKPERRDLKRRRPRELGGGGERVPPLG